MASSARSPKVLKVSFSGNKSREYPRFIRPIIMQMKPGSKVLDLFGGSGLIAVNIKRDRPDLVVTLNDFDDYLGPEFPVIADIKRDIINELDSAGIAYSGKACPDAAKLQAIVRRHLLGKSPNVIYRVARCFMFSAHAASCSLADFETTIKNVRYRRINSTFYGRAMVYYKAAQAIDNRIRADYRNVDLSGFDLVILDPPYMNCAQKQYSASFFSVCGTIDIITRIPPGCKFMLFNQNHADIAKLLEFGRIPVISSEKTRRSVAKDVWHEDSVFYCSGRD